MRVLVADDDITSRLLLSETLSAWDYDVEVAVDGLEAMAILDKDDAPRLVVLDWMMPGMDGLELCRKIKARKGRAYTYAILLTSKSEKEDVVAGLEAGADDFLSKPVDPSELRSRLEVGRRVLDYDEALAEKNEQLHTLIHAMPDLVCFKDGEGRIREINDSFLTLLGLDAEQCIGMTDAELARLSPELADTILDQQALDEAAWQRGGGPTVSEESLAKTQWGVRTYSVMRIPLTHSDKTRRGLVYLARDITEQKALEERLREEASYDALTGLANRRHFQEFLLKALATARRHRRPLSFCLCDIDNFKNINDTYGHVAGDRVLTAFSETIRTSLRTPDIPGRFGGDEFCIVLPDTTGKDALIAVERIREQFQAASFTADDNQNFSASASFGLVELDNQTKDTEVLFERADKALYEAKRGGRNQVHLAMRVEAGVGRIPKVPITKGAKG